MAQPREQRWGSTPCGRRSLAHPSVPVGPGCAATAVPQPAATDRTGDVTYREPAAATPPVDTESHRFARAVARLFDQPHRGHDHASRVGHRPLSRLAATARDQAARSAGRENPTGAHVDVRRTPQGSSSSMMCCCRGRRDGRVPASSRARLAMSSTVKATVTGSPLRQSRRLRG